MKSFEGKLSVGRMRGNVNTERPIRIEVRDSNYKMVSVVYVSLADFTDATVGNAAMVECTVESFQ